MSQQITIRTARQEDHPFIREMFYEAVFVPAGEKKPAYDIIFNPLLLKYTENWMKPTDAGLIAEMDGIPVGAVWVRLFGKDQRGYGFVNEATPELSMAVEKKHQNQGIGRALLNEMFEVMMQAGYESVSLSVSKENTHAVKLYQSAGFVTVKENDEDFVMVKELQ